MVVFEVALTWIHILCAVIFLGTMFVGTFVLLPVLKTHLDYEHRQRFIVNFIPRVRSIVRVVVALLLLSGITHAALLHFTHSSPASIGRLSVFGTKTLLAAIPVVIFLVAPRVLGRMSKEGLCCDPDAEDPPLFMGVMTSTGAALHYAAISGGWLAVLFGVILTHMR
jgi:uncharacterized membrane protein